MPKSLNQRLRDPELIAKFINLPINTRLIRPDGEEFFICTKHPPYTTGRGVRPWMYTILPYPDGGFAKQKTVYELIGQGYEVSVVL